MVKKLGDKDTWYYIRRDDGLVQFADNGEIVHSQRLARAISNNPKLWNGVEVDEFPLPLVEIL